MNMMVGNIRCEFLRQVTLLQDVPVVCRSFRDLTLVMYACQTQALGVLQVLSRVRRRFLKFARDIEAAVAVAGLPGGEIDILDEEEAAFLVTVKRRIGDLKRVIGIVFDLSATPDGKTPLHYACSHPDDSADIVELLLTDRVDVNAADADGIQPLHLSAWLGHMRSTKLLLRPWSRAVVFGVNGTRWKVYVRFEICTAPTIKRAVLLPAQFNTV